MAKNTAQQDMLVKFTGTHLTRVGDSVLLAMYIYINVF